MTNERIMASLRQQIKELEPRLEKLERRHEDMIRKGATRKLRRDNRDLVSLLNIELDVLKRQLQAMEDIGETTFVEHTDDSLYWLQMSKQQERSRQEEKKKELQSPRAQDKAADA
eukprot:Tamp_23957.p3 GENE.Tamp_23957~~Tamp_23957.p3  ORF type:complete len:115 (-),score=28.34 Tamp_23957:15-359(-)